MIFVHRLRLSPLWHRDPQKMRALQEKRLRELVAHVKKASPFYARHFRGIDPDRCKLADLPTVTKSEMMAHFDDVVTDRRIRKADLEPFLADPANLGRFYLDRYAISHTSGTQGQPAIIVQDAEAMRLTFAVQVARGNAVSRMILPHLNRFFNPARFALFTQRPGFYPSGSAYSYLPKAALPFFKMLRLSVFDPVAETVARLNEFRPQYVTGFVSSLEVLAREEAAGRLKLRQNGLLQLTNMSEPLPASTAKRLEEVFGVHVFDQYAMGECMALSCGCSQFTGSHLNADLAVLEVVDENNRPVPNGQPGKKVLLTNLYNHVQPFIRYEVDDVVTMSAAPCPCGSPLPRIESVEGRRDEKFWVQDGDRYRDLPYYLFLAAIHHDLDIAEHQVLQTGHNDFVVRVAPQPGKSLSADRIRGLVQQSVDQEGLSHLIRLNIEIVDHIARGPSGKAERARNLFGPPPATMRLAS
jgi:phenylacetate-coenzyme A ligase PaaK-like adenylate-forming protein